MTQPRKKRGGLSGETLGGMLAGFDQQIMRTLPPPHELVQKGAPVRGLTGEDGGTITIDLPDHLGSDDGPRPAPPTIASERADDAEETPTDRVADPD